MSHHSQSCSYDKRPVLHQHYIIGKQSPFKRLGTGWFLVMCQMKEYAIILAHTWRKKHLKAQVYRTPICLIYLLHWWIISAVYGIGKTIYFTWLECLSSAAGVLGSVFSPIFCLLSLFIFLRGPLAAAAFCWEYGWCLRTQN